MCKNCYIKIVFLLYILYALSKIKLRTIAGKRILTKHDFRGNPVRKIY